MGFGLGRTQIGGIRPELPLRPTTSPCPSSTATSAGQIGSAPASAGAASLNRWDRCAGRAHDGSGSEDLVGCGAAQPAEGVHRAAGLVEGLARADPSEEPTRGVDLGRARRDIYAATWRRLARRDGRRRESCCRRDAEEIGGPRRPLRNRADRRNRGETLRTRPRGMPRPSWPPATREGDRGLMNTKGRIRHETLRDLLVVSAPDRWRSRPASRRCSGSRRRRSASFYARELDKARLLGEPEAYGAEIRRHRPACRFPTSN